MADQLSVILDTWLIAKEILAAVSIYYEMHTRLRCPCTVQWVFFCQKELCILKPLCLTSFHEMEISVEKLKTLNVLFVNFGFVWIYCFKMKLWWKIKENRELFTAWFHEPHSKFWISQIFLANQCLV